MFELLIIFTSVLIFSSNLVYGGWHTANQIIPGTFLNGNYTFPDNLFIGERTVSYGNVYVGNLSTTINKTNYKSLNIEGFGAFISLLNYNNTFSDEICFYNSSGYGWSLGKSPSGSFYLNRVSNFSKKEFNAITITPSGDVGIRTNNPQTTLDVNGTINVNGTIKVSNPPIAPNDVATKAYVDAAVASASSSSGIYITTLKSESEARYNGQSITSCNSYPSPFCPTGWNINSSWNFVTAGYYINGSLTGPTVFVNCWTETLCEKS